MSKKIDHLLSRRLVLASLSATAAAAALPGVAFAKDPDIYKIACSEPEASPAGAALGRWKKAAETAGEDRFKLKLMFDDKVPGGAQILKGIKKNDDKEDKFAGAMVPSLAFWERVPRLTVFDLPYLLGDDAQVDRALEAGRKDIAAALSNNGLKLLWLFPMGHRVVFARNKTVTGPDSAKGLKIAVRPGTMSKLMWDALGAETVEVAPPDVKAKLDAGAIEAVEATVVDGFERGWHEAAKTISITNHITEVGMLVMDLGTFDELKDKDQEALLTERKKSEEKVTDHYRKREGVLLDELKGGGRTVYVMPNGNHDAMKEATKDVQKVWKDGAGKGGDALFATLKKA